MRILPRLVAAAVAIAALSAQDGNKTDGKTDSKTVDTPFGPATIVHERAAAQAPACTLWVAYLDTAGSFADHAQYLADLQARFADKGVRIVVCLPEPHARKVGMGEPAFAVAALANGVAAGGEAPGNGGLSALTLGNSAVPAVTCQGLDGAVDRIAAALGDRFETTAPGEVEGLIESLLNSVGDGGDFGEPVAHCVAALPKSGLARALTVLFQWWCKGDVVAAKAAFDDAMKVLTDEPVPLCLFADYVLRGDHSDPSFARQLAMALAPVAAAAPDGVFTQLVYLRALLRAGQDRNAGRVAATLQKQLDGSPLNQLVFAETLMDATDPKPYRDLAERALARAEQGGVDRRWLVGARHKILSRCGDPAAELDKLMQAYRESEAFSNSLNNDAWYIVTQGVSMGRFDTLALAQVREMQRTEGAGMINGNKDTVALVLFVNGFVQEAVDLQTVAAANSGNDPEYIGRLARFENTLQASKKAAPAPK